MTIIKVLYVEDDILIQDDLATALAEAGFDVQVAANGTDAIEALEVNKGAIRALITDIKLGKGPDGWAVAKRARELIPDVPVVYVSGDSTHDWSSRGVPHSMVIGKPFAPTQIIVAISSLLNTSDQ